MCVCLEFDSSLLCYDFPSPMIVPWSIKDKWRKNMKTCEVMEFKVSHIFRERNQYANKLANIEIEKNLDFK